MTNEQTITLVFKDQAGEYYLVPLETLAQGHVAQEHKAEVERLIAEGAAVDDDVRGHHPLFFAVVVLDGVLAGYSAVEIGKTVTAMGTLQGRLHQ
jgi:hypothetical protein